MPSNIYSKWYEKTRQREHELSKVKIDGIEKYPEDIPDQSLTGKEVIEANSWGHNYLVPKWNDETLIKKIELYRELSLPEREYPCITYNQMLLYLLLPELMRRYKQKTMDHTHTNL